jgi:hypothetical protein
LAVFLEAFKSLDHGTYPPFGQSRKASICGSTKSGRPPNAAAIAKSRAVVDEELCLSAYRAERSQTAKYLILWLPDLGSAQGPADKQAGAPKNLIFGRINRLSRFRPRYSEIRGLTAYSTAHYNPTHYTSGVRRFQSTIPKTQSVHRSMMCIHIEDRALKPIMPLMPVGFPQSLSSP